MNQCQHIYKNNQRCQVKTKNNLCGKHSQKAKENLKKSSKAYWDRVYANRVKLTKET